MSGTLVVFYLSFLFVLFNRWNYNSCIGSASGPAPIQTTSSLYYPDWLGTSDICVNDGNEPAYMSQNPIMWMHSTLEACCEQNYL